MVRLAPAPKRSTPSPCKSPKRWTGRAPIPLLSSSASSTAWGRAPSQLLLFLLAANLGGTGRGFLGLAMFLVGLIAMNTVMCASMAGLSRAGNRRPAIARAITVVTAGYSVVVGVIFLLGSSSSLPPLGGG